MTKNLLIRWIGCFSNFRESFLEQDMETFKEHQGEILIISLNQDLEMKLDFHEEMKDIERPGLLSRSRPAFQINHIGKEQKTRAMRHKSSSKVRYMMFDKKLRI